MGRLSRKALCVLEGSTGALSELISPPPSLYRPELRRQFRSDQTYCVDCEILTFIKKKTQPNASRHYLFSEWSASYQESVMRMEVGGVGWGIVGCISRRASRRYKKGASRRYQ